MGFRVCFLGGSSEICLCFWSRLKWELSKVGLNYDLISRGPGVEPSTSKLCREVI